MGLRGDCDHASWISISKQNKCSPSLLLLLGSSHKPFQVPCRTFPHYDLYLLAPSRLGSPSLSSPSLPTAAFFHPPLFFLLHFSPNFCGAHTSRSIKLSPPLSSRSPPLPLPGCITAFVSMCHQSLCLSESPGWQRRWSWWPLSRNREERGVRVLPWGEWLISVNSTQESM